ncbi:hypothetical protein PLICRDRAFT_97623 [Plicaturopsis crispa FD-325 SS-3]|nr:hypothetical protein PLICRDRAFT_97623 [Plicaturopsis crispa FD-325 SS-3]
MVERLRSTRNIDKTMVSMAVRACLALFCGWIGSSWFFDHTETEQFLNEIYGRIQHNETQAVAGQWRALTRAYLQQMLGGDVAVHSRITSDIDNALASILTVAGFAEDSDTTVHPAANRKKLSSVVDLALQLNRRIGEDIASTDLETVIVPADREFDPTVMDNTLTAVTASGATVLCTTDLGVRRLERINIAQGAPVVVGCTGTVLLKPRVICKSM